MLGTGILERHKAERLKTVINRTKHRTQIHKINKQQHVLRSFIESKSFFLPSSIDSKESKMVSKQHRLAYFEVVVICTKSNF